MSVPSFKCHLYASEAQIYIPSSNCLTELCRVCSQTAFYPSPTEFMLSSRAIFLQYNFLSNGSSHLRGLSDSSLLLAFHKCCQHPESACVTPSLGLWSYATTISPLDLAITSYQLFLFSSWPGCHSFLTLLPKGG